MTRLELYPYKFNVELHEDYEDFSAIDKFIADAWLDNKAQIEALERELYFIQMDTLRSGRITRLKHQIGELRALDTKLFNHFYECLYQNRQGEIDNG